MSDFWGKKAAAQRAHERQLVLLTGGIFAVLLGSWKVWTLWARSPADKLAHRKSRAALRVRKAGKKAERAAKKGAGKKADKALKDALKVEGEYDDLETMASGKCPDVTVMAKRGDDARKAKKVKAKAKKVKAKTKAKDKKTKKADAEQAEVERKARQFNKARKKVKKKKAKKGAAPATPAAPAAAAPVAATP